jgi:hypothetical protein
MLNTNSGELVKPSHKEDMEAGNGEDGEVNIEEVFESFSELDQSTAK